MEPEPLSLEGSIQNLKSFGISAYNTTWKKFESEHVSAEHMQKFDMMLTEPPLDYDPSSLGEFMSFTKRMLHPGGCLFVILAWSQYYDWVKAARKEELRVMDHPFIFCPDTSAMQRTRATAFTQRAAFPALVAFAPGKHPQNFKLDLKSDFLNNRCTHKRKFSVIDNVPHPAFRLLQSGSKRAFVQNERSPILLADIMTTFSRLGGSILDPFAGTLSLGCAAVMTGRTCTVIECDAVLFNAAVDRLLHFTSTHGADKVSNENGGDTCRIINDFFKNRDVTDGFPNQSQAMDSGGTDCLATGPADKRVKYNNNHYHTSSKNGNRADDSTSASNKQAPLKKGQKQISDLQCAVAGCILGQDSPANGHNCKSCSAPVHLLCCIRVLKQTVEEPEDPLFCSLCYAS